MKTNKSNNWAIGCRMAMWRINTQVHQTTKDTPYHLTYSQHLRVGISNLPVSAAILQNLSTEAELQDLYSNYRHHYPPLMDRTARTSHQMMPD